MAPPLRPLHTYDVESMIDWHNRSELAHAAAGNWVEAHRHAYMASRLEAIEIIARLRQVDRTAAADRALTA